MARKSDDSSRAGQVVDQILAESRTIEIDDDIVVSDLQEEAADFNQDIELLEDFALEMPAARVANELVPVSLSYFTGNPLFGASQVGRKSRWWRGDPYYDSWVRDALRELVSEPPTPNISRLQLNIEKISLSDAISAFRARATDFLAARIAGVRGPDGRGFRASPQPSLNILQTVGGPTVTTPGCLFSVSSNSPGLRAFWSGAYRISHRYFGHPTTVTGVLQSGTYIFGVDGGNYLNRIHWDTKAVVSLPGVSSIHLNY